MKGILLAGGHGTRLYPLTAVSSKQLVAIYDKPMVYYSLTTVMLAGVREVLVVSTPEDVSRFEALLGDGSQWGISLSYGVQDEPRGIAEALLIGADYLGDEPALLMLGDNLLYGRLDFLRAAVSERKAGDAVIFAYQVSNPSDYGVVEFDRAGRAVRLEEKPQKPTSRWAVPGIYLYPKGVAAEAAALAPSPRGELEITDLNRRYLDAGRLHVRIMGRGIAWLDTGTPRSLLNAANFIEAIETRQGLIIGSPEEAGFRMGYIDASQLISQVETLPASEYRSYLQGLPNEISTYDTGVEAAFVPGDHEELVGNGTETS